MKKDLTNTTTKLIMKTILVIMVLGIFSCKTFAQDMLYLCQPTSYVKSLLSAYPERLVIKEFTEGIDKDDKGKSFSWAKLTVHDNQLNCDWKYMFLDNQCNNILLILKKKSDIDNWIIGVLDKYFYRYKDEAKGKIFWYEKDKPLGKSAVASIEWETNSIFFVRFLCD